MVDPKKGKYTEEENEIIISTINKAIQEGRREREVIREISDKLNRGYAGIMSHVRKLRLEYPERFIAPPTNKEGNRLNSWGKEEEELVIETVNKVLEQGKPLAAAIQELEGRLSRTQGAIYQRIYTLRRKYPEKFKYLPVSRPRRRRKLSAWQLTQTPVQKIQNESETKESPVSLPAHPSMAEHVHPTTEEVMIFQAFEERYGRLNQEAREQLIHLMRKYGCTRVSIALLTLHEDKTFPLVITEFLAKRLQSKFLK